MYIEISLFQCHPMSVSLCPQHSLGVNTHIHIANLFLQPGYYHNVHTSRSTKINTAYITWNTAVLLLLLLVEGLGFRDVVISR